VHGYFTIFDRMFNLWPRQLLLIKSASHLIPFLLLLFGCVERYYPDEEEVQVGTLVISAHLADLPGVQSIYLSRSTNLEFPSFDPVTGCYVEVEREGGQGLEFLETEPGEYAAQMDGSFLKTGDSYRLLVITPSGAQYESEFETMHPATDIEGLYFVRKDRPTEDPDFVDEGIQFYIDFEIEKDSARYLRWQLIETYEMHNPDYNITRMYDVDRRTKDIPDTAAWKTCWITMEVPEIYTLDLGGVGGTSYREMPLHFVSSETQRLHHRYSLLVRQFSLSEEAFWYWDELGKNIQSKGNLFDTQPSLTPGNICNVSDENERIIGFFSISGISEKRIMVEDVPGLKLRVDPDFCAPGKLPFSFGRLSSAFLPYYMASSLISGSSELGGVPKRCIDCREYNNSSHIRPDYW
jgi:hypothetical protein